MPKYLVTAYRIAEYQVEVEAENERSALESLDNWVSDDFEDYEVQVEWTLEADLNE